MSGRADAWFPFYVGDYLRDTRHLTTEQHGAYLLLLMDCWSKRGPLPDNDAALAMIVGLPMRAWRRLRPAIAPFFTIADGQWTSPRMMKEIERSKEISEKRKEAGKRGGRPTNSSPKPKAIALQLGGQTGLQTETHARVASPLPSEGTYSVPNGTGAVAPIDPDKKAWQEGVDLLKSHGVDEKPARQFIGKLVKDSGAEARALLPIIAKCIEIGTQDPRSYLTKAVQALADRRGGGSPAPPQADEPINWAMRMSFWRKDGTWLGAWGPTPREKGCQCPAEMLEAG